MNIQKILFVSPMYKELQTILNAKVVNEGKQFRFYTEEEVTGADYLWADAFVSFKRPENFSFGNIKWVHSLGAGVDKILKKRRWKEDVILTRTICSFGEKISEYCLSYILRDVQQHAKYDELKTKKEWHEVTPIPLNEKKVVIYGTGVIGQEVARVLSNFGVNVYGVSLSGKTKEYFARVFSSESEYHHILEEADYVINTMPLTERTIELFNHEIFHHFSQTMFINVGRGESVDKQSLLDALEQGYVKLAILDVFQEEPLPVSDTYWGHTKVIVTPHISAITTPEEGIDCFLETLHNIEANKNLNNLVDLKKGF